MDEIVSLSPSQSLPPPPSTAAPAPTGGGRAPSIRSGTAHRGPSSSSLSSTSHAKKECLSFAVSVQERLRYIKALLLGQAKKMRARNEREATEADLRTVKMQVDEADAAEERIHDKYA